MLWGLMSGRGLSAAQIYGECGNEAPG